MCGRVGKPEDACCGIDQKPREGKPRILKPPLQEAIYHADRFTEVIKEVTDNTADVPGYRFRIATRHRV